jgi:CubicO group peptidase (beta-lactamase class C family)
MPFRGDPLKQHTQHALRARNTAAHELIHGTSMTREKCFILAGLLFLACTAQTFSQNVVSGQSMLSREQTQKLIQESELTINDILSKEIRLPGLAIALVSRDDMPWVRSFGYRDALRREMADTSTMYGILSISKTVTVTGLMMAVQEGLINLDVPITTYLPGFHINSRFPEEPMSHMTMRHLLSMTSGLTHDAPIGNNADPQCPSYEAHIQSIAQTWLRFRTGERAEYSNLGVELAAHILETVIRRPFTEYIQKRVFDPLAMKRSTYDSDRIRSDNNRAIGNNKNVERVPLENPMLAPGGVYASISDMARFLQFHMNDGTVHGTRLIQEQTLKQMRAMPFPMNDQITGYGMGLWTGYYHLGGQEVRWLSHGGGGFGFRCQMKWLPDLGYGVIVLTNSQDHDNVNEDLVEEILVKIVELLTHKKELGPSDWLSRHMPARTVDSSYLPAGLEGRYNGTNDDMVFLIKNRKFGYASGNNFVPVTPLSRYECISKRYVYRFICDTAGSPVSVERPYDGTVWRLGSAANEPKGPDKKEWVNYVGSYVRKRFGVGEKFYNVIVKNGWLHFQGDGQDFRLSEHLPGLFFTPDGEAVDFRSSTFTFRNIRLYKACD